MSIFNSSFPVILLGNILLREIQPHNDAPHFYNYMNHPQVKAFISQTDLPGTIDAAVNELDYWCNLFRYKHSIFWGLEDVKANKLIGTLGFNNYTSIGKRAEVSYDMDFNYWGQGIMYSSLKEIISFGEKNMDIKRFQATVESDNIRSIKLLERLGFVKEGLLKKYHYPKDSFMYAKIIEYS